MRSNKQSLLRERSLRVLNCDHIIDLLNWCRAYAPQACVTGVNKRSVSCGCAENHGLFSESRMTWRRNPHLCDVFLRFIPSLLLFPRGHRKNTIISWILYGRCWMQESDTCFFREKFNTHLAERWMMIWVCRKNSSNATAAISRSNGIVSKRWDQQGVPLKVSW